MPSTLQLQAAAIDGEELQRERVTCYHSRSKKSATTLFTRKQDMASGRVKSSWRGEEKRWWQTDCFQPHKHWELRSHLHCLSRNWTGEYINHCTGDAPVHFWWKSSPCSVTMLQRSVFIACWFDTLSSAWFFHLFSSLFPHYYRHATGIRSPASVWFGLSWQKTECQTTTCLGTGQRTRGRAGVCVSPLNHHGQPSVTSHHLSVTVIFLQ